MIKNVLVYHSQLGLGIIQGEGKEDLLEVSFLGYAPNVLVEKDVLFLVNRKDIEPEYQKLLKKLDRKIKKKEG